MSEGSFVADEAYRTRTWILTQEQTQHYESLADALFADAALSTRFMQTSGFVYDAARFYPELQEQLSRLSKEEMAEFYAAHAASFRSERTQTPTGRYVQGEFSFTARSISLKPLEENPAYAVGREAIRMSLMGKIVVGGQTYEFDPNVHKYTFGHLCFMPTYVPQSWQYRFYGQPNLLRARAGRTPNGDILDKESHLAVFEQLLKNEVQPMML